MVWILLSDFPHQILFHSVVILGDQVEFGRLLGHRDGVNGLKKSLAHNVASISHQLLCKNVNLVNQTLFGAGKFHARHFKFTVLCLR